MAVSGYGAIYIVIIMSYNRQVTDRVYMEAGNVMNGDVSLIQKVDPLGLLPHEARFLEGAILRAQKQQQLAQLAVGEANLSSGGDWAFDDPATQFAAQEALLKDSFYKELLNLYNEGRAAAPESYPSEDEKLAKPGSRVKIRTPRYADTLDIVTRRIPGIPEDEEHDVSLVSANSALGRAILNSTVGQVLLWEIDGRKFQGELEYIDQHAQKAFYTSMGLID